MNIEYLAYEITTLLRYIGLVSRTYVCYIRECKTFALDVSYSPVAVWVSKPFAIRC